MKDGFASLVVLALVSAVRVAVAADVLVSGERLLVVRTKLVTFTAKEGAPYPVPAGGSLADPTLAGGSLRVWDIGNPANQEIYPLPAGGWAPLSGSGYRYNGAGTPADPCDVEVHSHVIDVHCHAPTTTLSTPLSGEGGFILTLGVNAQRYCAVFGGLLANNSADIFKRLDAPVPPVCEPSPASFDEELAGRVAVVRSQSLAKFVSRPGLALLPDSAGEAPVVDGATIRVFDTGGGAGDISYPLPSGRWKSARRGYKYRGPIGDPCPTVLLMPSVVKAICRREAVDLTTPFTGDAAFVITAGTSARYCVQFGGDTIRNDAILFKRKTAPAPGSCPSSPSGAFLEEGVGAW